MKSFIYVEERENMPESNNDNQNNKNWKQKVGSFASFCGKGISNATLVACGEKGTARREALNFVARNGYRVTNLTTNVVIDAGKKIVGKREDPQHAFFANSWDAFWGNLGRRKTLIEAHKHLEENPPIHVDEEVDIDLKFFAPEFEKPHNRVLNTGFNIVSLAGIPAGMFLTAKWAIVKPSARTFAIAGKSWAQAGLTVLPKLKSIGYDIKDGVVHTGLIVSGNMDKIPSSLRTGTMSDSIKDRAEGTKTIFMKEIAEMGYTVPDDYLFVKDIHTRVKDGANWFEEAVDYKPKDVKLGPLKFKW